MRLMTSLAIHGVVRRVHGYRSHIDVARQGADSGYLPDKAVGCVASYAGLLPSSRRIARRHRVHGVTPFQAVDMKRSFRVALAARTRGEVPGNHKGIPTSSDMCAAW